MARCTVLFISTNEIRSNNADTAVSTSASERSDWFMESTICVGTVISLTPGIAFIGADIFSMESVLAYWDFTFISISELNGIYFQNFHQVVAGLLLPLCQGIC